MLKTRGLYLLLLIASFFFPYLYGGKIPYMVFHVVLLIPLISFIHVVLVFFRFKYVQDFDRKHIVRGDSVNFIVKFSNEDFFPYPYLTAIFKSEESYFVSLSDRKKFSLAPYSSKTFTFSFKCRYRGTFEIGLERLEIVDFLGLFRLKYKVKSLRNVVVHPKVIPLDDLHMRDGYLSDSQNISRAGFEDMTSIAGIRKYAIGDVFKKIHWKLTAKMDELMVKEFNSTYETSAVIILDLSANNHAPVINMAIEDRVIESAIAIINFCLSKWIPVRLFYYTDIINEAHGDNPLDFDEIYSTLAQIKFGSDVSVSDLIKLYAESNTEATNLFVVTSNLDYTLVDSLSAAQISGNNVYLVFAQPYDLSSAPEEIGHIFEFLPDICIQAVNVDSSDNIKPILEGAWSHG